MEKTKYKLILIPSSDDENEYEGLTFDEAVALSETREDSAQVFSFDTEKERTAFLQGVAAMEGYMGEGLAYTSEEFAKPLSEQLIDAFKAKYPAGGDETESDEIELDNSVNKKEERPTVEGTKGAYLTELKSKIAKLKHCFPIDLTKVNQDFEIENGGLAVRLNEGDIDYTLKQDDEEFSAEYENLGVTDLEEILSILDEVEAISDKMSGTVKNENF